MAVASFSSTASDAPRFTLEMRRRSFAALPSVTPRVVVSPATRSASPAMAKPGSRCAARGFSRRIDRPSEWNVWTGTSPACAGRRCFSRSRISAAARRVKVTARQLSAGTPRSPTRCAILCVSIRVFPEPGPAMTISGPSATAAARWSASRAARIGDMSEAASIPLPSGERSAGEAEAGSREDRGIGPLTGRLRRHHPLPGGERIRQLPTLLVRLPGRRGRIEKQRTGLPLLKLARLEEPDHAIFAVIACFADHPAGTKPRDRLGKKRRAGGFDLFDRRRFQYLKLRSQPASAWS